MLDREQWDGNQDATGVHTHNQILPEAILTGVAR